MAAGKWDFDRGTVAQAVGALFAGKDSEPPKNPFDHREERSKSPEELAELAAAKERIEELKRQVFQQAREQHGTR